MLKVFKEQFTSALSSLGLRSGEGVLVHSALQYLGKPQGGVVMYLQALLENLGIPQSTRDVTPFTTTGTLVVPTFNFGFARGQPFDLQSTVSEGMGVFSELVRTHPLAQRTMHPLQSLAVIGYYASDLAARDTPSAFDPGSAFERMVELDFSILLLGADIQAVSLLHLAEQRLQVPYRFWKEFSGEVQVAKGWKRKTYRMFARDLKIDPQLDLRPVQHLLEERQQWSSIRLNYGEVARCRMTDFVYAVTEFLENDPWSLVTNPPATSVQR
jgi:aminoglycoside 3-N-acetyltransferase